MTTSSHEVTQLLILWGQGEPAAIQRLLPLVYRELHKLAKRYMGQQDPGHTLQTTALLHEAYLKLTGDSDRHWENRHHFLGVAAKAMRHVLVDHARAKHAGKRGGAVKIVPLDDGVAVATGRTAELVALDDALTALAALHPRQSQVVELRYFGGLTVDEAATILKVSPDTVMRDWSFAKAWLHSQIRRTTGG